MFKCVCVCVFCSSVQAPSCLCLCNMLTVFVTLRFSLAYLSHVSTILLSASVIPSLGAFDIWFLKCHIFINMKIVCDLNVALHTRSNPSIVIYQVKRVRLFIRSWVNDSYPTLWYCTISKLYYLWHFGFTSSQARIFYSSFNYVCCAYAVLWFACIVWMPTTLLKDATSIVDATCSFLCLESDSIVPGKHISH